MLLVRSEYALRAIRLGCHYVCTAMLLLLYRCVQIPVDALTLKVILPEGATVLTTALLPQGAKAWPRWSGYVADVDAAPLLRVLAAAMMAGTSAYSTALGVEAATVRVSKHRRWGLLDGYLLHGRPVVVAEARFAMSSGSSDSLGNDTVWLADPHPHVLIVHYKLPFLWMVYKPLHLSVLIFGVFCSVSLLSRCIDSGSRVQRPLSPSTPPRSQLPAEKED